jgi:acetyl esterase/lipase
MKIIACFIFLFAAIPDCIYAQDSLSFTKTEIIYGRKDGMALTMVMLVPKEKTNGKAIINVVSGNWRSTYDRIPSTINRVQQYLKRGYTVFAVMHASQPRYTIPDEISDLKRAVRFIRYNSNNYKIAGNKIGITGSSSGGHLSLMVGLSDDKIDTTSKDPVDRVSSRVQAVAIFFPPTDFLNWGQQNSNLSKAKAGLTLAGVVSAFDFKEWNDTTKTYKVISDTIKILQIVKQTSPIYSVSADDPPVLIIHGDADKTVPLQQSEMLIKKLKDANVQNELIIKKGGGHGWTNMEIEEQSFVNWFDKYLK